MKSIFRSKTFWLAVLTILGGIVEFIFNLPPGVAISTILLGIAQIIIRAFTNSAILGTPGARVKR